MKTISRSSVRPRRAITFIAVSLAYVYVVVLPVGIVQAQSADNTQRQIETQGFLPGGDAYWVRAKAKYGRDKTKRAGNLIATKASGGNVTETIGDEPPQGFGKGFTWDRKDDEILLVMFINPADNLGISVSGLQQDDTIRISSATGIAAFSKDKGNPAVSSLVGLVGVGVKVVLPEAIPIVEAAEKYVQEQFKGTGEPSKHRDTFGVDPGSGHKAKQEGGIVICMPEAGGTYYSGNDGQRERWIKAPGDRTDANRPAHVKYGWFPIQGEPNSRTVRGSVFDQLYVLAWDHKFEDNTGYYKVFMHIKKPTSTSPTEVVQ
jgi:hypothetical protein